MLPRPSATGQNRKFAVLIDASNRASQKHVRSSTPKLQKLMLSTLQNLLLLTEIEDAFPGCSEMFSDSFIEENPSMLEIDGGVDLLMAVPAYMAWCTRNGHRPSLLVHDYTVNALAEFGRTKNRQIAHLDFKHRCTAEQKRAVLHFLRWYLNPGLLVDTEQVARSIKRWSAS